MSRKLLWIMFITVVIFLSLYGFGEREPEPSIAEEPQIFAHRGANDRFNESTITAYAIASQDGVDALEIDLRMTKDEVLVAMHDETINRTTNGYGKVFDYSLKELKSFQTVSVFNNETLSEEIPTLEEIIETFHDNECYYIETRLVEGELMMEEPLVRLLNEYDLISKDLVMVQSFSDKSLQTISKLAPDLHLTLLFKRGKFELNKALSVNYSAIGMDASDVTLNIVNELHKHGKEVHVFFNNRHIQKEEQERVKALNVDGYFTDDILFTQRMLDGTDFLSRK